MFRYFVCSLVLFAFVYFANKWLRLAFDNWGLVAGFSLCALMLLIGFLDAIYSGKHRSR